ncbi:vancomycin high temperature exclusion protein [Streptomyces microflavus]|uniref:SanA/YdcF family protein n=1 Tax=Streptomyces microflavus TaxID=1919 RepID=UPI00382B55B9
MRRARGTREASEAQVPAGASEAQVPAGASETEGSSEASEAGAKKQRPWLRLHRLSVRRLSVLRLPRSRRGRRLAVQGVMALCVLALLPATWMRVGTGSQVGTTADAPAREVAMVFGAGLWKGRPTPYLAHRLDAAAELYRAGKVKVVLVTGDNSRVEYDEPDAMRTYLTERGVPDDRIVSDYAGFDSWDSCVRAKKIFGVDRAVLVSQGFHIHRATTLCRSAGIDAYGVGVDEPRDATWYYGGTRELAASGKAALDALLRPDPRFLGPQEAGVAEALASATP